MLNRIKTWEALEKFSEDTVKSMILNVLSLSGSSCTLVKSFHIKGYSIFSKCQSVSN